MLGMLKVPFSRQRTSLTTQIVENRRNFHVSRLEYPEKEHDFVYYKIYLGLLNYILIT